MSMVGSNWHVASKKTGGRVAVPKEVRLAQGERVKLLRKRLDRTQDQVADAGRFPRADMSRFEKGEKLSAAANQEKLARGFDLPLEVFRSYLAMKSDLESTIRLVGGSGRVTEPDKYQRVLKVAAKLGKSADEALRIAETTRGYKSTTTDAEIARWFDGSPPSGNIDLSDDLGGGASALRKLSPRRR